MAVGLVQRRAVLTLASNKINMGRVQRTNFGLQRATPLAGRAVAASPRIERPLSSTRAHEGLVCR